MKRLNPASTGFDFDGVIADTMAAFVRIACADYGLCKVRPEDFSAFDTAPLPQEIIDEIFAFLTAQPLRGGVQPMPGATELIRQLCTHSPLTIVTARPDAGPVEEWLAHFFAPKTCACIQVLATGDHDGKEPFIRQAGLNAFIDDRAETCLALAEGGIDAHVFAQPWNQGKCAGLPVVQDWAELGRLFGVAGF